MQIKKIHCLFIATLSLLYSCAAYLTTPVGEMELIEKQEVSAAPSKNPERTYTVVKGDTLFSISMKYDVDYKQLAEANNIAPPYLIKPNDVIYLDHSENESLTNSKSIAAVNRDKKPVIQADKKKTGVAGEKGVKTKQRERLQVVKEGAEKEPIPVITNAVKQDVNQKWFWPVQGKLVREFSPKDSLSKGIDIVAEIGVPIKSTRSGLVVYAGSGLKGYGNLVIIRHDEIYISAYAHNREIFVKEGDKVNQGDKIAELGMTGTQTPKLHFEIRKQGKPIDPLGLLPKL